MPPWAIVETGEATLDIDRHVEHAIEVRRSGDLAGAAALLDALDGKVPAPRRPWWLYQRGITAELAGDLERARDLYREAIVLTGDDVLASADARFRLAGVLEELGDATGALREVEALEGLRGLPPADALSVALQAGIAGVAAGERRAIGDLEAALGEAEAAGSHPWLRAKARYVIARALLDEADATLLVGGERKVVRRLTARAEAVAAAEQQVLAVIQVGEVEWILAALLRLGDSYRALGDALVAAPVPRRLEPAEAEVYRAEVASRAENVRRKARHAWSQGVELAARFGVESRHVATLRDRLAAPSP